MGNIGLVPPSVTGVGDELITSETVARLVAPTELVREETVTSGIIVLELMLVVFELGIIVLVLKLAGLVGDRLEVPSAVVMLLVVVIFIKKGVVVMGTESLKLVVLIFEGDGVVVAEAILLVLDSGVLERVDVGRM